MLKGSQTETGINNNKIVVVDDPVSSLDNDILFVVSTLVREIIDIARNNNQDIKQVFVLTHNIYFHKEVTYSHKRRGASLPEEAFFLVKKIDGKSFVEKVEGNPVKTSYELLWREVKNLNCDNATIRNVMRRILENYFKMLGNIDLHKLHEKFTGDDKLRCKALVSWVHDGSHSALDEDYYTPLSGEEVLKFKVIFKEIFDKTGHIEHYRMMTGDIDLSCDTVG